MATASRQRRTGQARLADRLQAIATLNEADLRAIGELPATVREIAPGQDIVREGDRTHESCVVIDGFLQRYKMMADGGRQILAFHVPGDVPDLQSLHLPRMDHTLAAVTASTIATIPHAALNVLMDACPGVAHALWRESLIDGAKFREWIVNLGGRPALPRLAHLFCELYVRNQAVGLGEPNVFVMPLTQALLGEALGLSAVHVNRTMVALRRRGLIATKGREMHILDWPALQAEAEFNPAYLHLREEGRDDRDA